MVNVPILASHTKLPLHLQITSVFLSLIGGNFSPQIFDGKIFPVLFEGDILFVWGFISSESSPDLIWSFKKICLYFVNPCKKIPNQTKIDMKSFKNRPSGFAGLN